MRADQPASDNRDFAAAVLLWLHLLNFARIVGLFLIGGYAHAHFQRSHEIYFPIFLIAMTVAAWLFWLRRAAHDRIGPGATAA